MKLHKSLKLGLLITGFGLMALAVNSMTPSTKAAPVTDPDGKALFVDVYKCEACHSVAAAQIETRAKSEKMKGPDLSGFKAPVALDAFAAFMRGEQKIDDKSHRLKFKGSDEELQAIVDWLGSLPPASH